MAAPLVSVVTPSFNYGRFLTECIESVREQDHAAIEHLIQDGGSTDETRDVVGRFEGEADAVFEPDAGQADALNRGFARARGEIYCWLNADDYWLHPRVVSEAVAALEAGADLVTAGGVFVDPTRRVLEHYLPPALGPRDAVHVRDGLRYLDNFLQPATFWRASVHSELRADLHYTFDWRLFLDMLDSGARLTVLETDWAGYRLHGGNKTTDDPAARRTEIAEILASQWGRRSAQYRWARAVSGGFSAVEAAHLERLKLKWPIQKLNRLVGRATRWRVYSC